jgi:hypothetical protein
MLQSFGYQNEIVKILGRGIESKIKTLTNLLLLQSCYRSCWGEVGNVP